MKRKILPLMLALLFFFPCFFTFAGCDTKIDPYIEVLGVARDYLVGDEFDFSGAKIVYHKADGETEDVAITNSMVTTQGTNSVGSFKMVFSFDGLYAEKRYEVYDCDTKIDPYIEVLGVARDYLVGDEFDFSGAKIVYHKADGETEDVAITNSMVTAHGTSSAGSYNMVFCYEGLYAEKNYEVYDIERLIQDVSDKTKEQDIVKQTMLSLDEYTSSSYEIYNNDASYIYTGKIDESYYENWCFSENIYMHSYESEGMYAGDSASVSTNEGTYGFDAFLERYFYCFENAEAVSKNILILSDGVFELSFCSDDEDAYVVIQDNLIISAVKGERDSSKNYYAYAMSYNSDEIPELPDLEWE